MNNDPTDFNRQPNETDYMWQARAKRYIIKHAPIDQRHFVRGGKPGAKGQRWILPTACVLIGLLFAFLSYAAGEDTRNLNGQNSQKGEFTVVDLETRYHDTKNNSNPYDVPVITIRNTPVVPLQSNGRQFTIGKPITVKYTQQGKVVAGFMDGNDKVTNDTATVGFFFAMLFVIGGLLIGRFYRGAVNLKYVEDEFARLSKQPSSPNTR